MMGNRGSEPTSTPGAVLRFQLSVPPEHDTRVVRVQLWLYVLIPRGSASNLTVSVSLVDDGGDPAWERRVLLSSRRVGARGSGWRSFPLLPALRGSFGAERRTLRLHVRSSGSGGLVVTASNGTHPRRPFVVAAATLRDPEHRVGKRSLRCSRDSALCCRRDHYVDFRAIGWNDWIISPEGYQLNYCVGQCPLHVAGSPGMASSFHSAVLSLVKANSGRAAAHSCCVPTRRRPLSLLYFDRNSNIVKTDVPDMIVDACGCS
ncbi:hypothetical protein ASZ78_003473 [Callipepla squamata]|uniref:TGF-beta family profile domain-containing protein n=1 Tax=Callipepla squamata TaxID=9009 RepID=A0A226MC00_CALSU|nr:hypothetical protein ASZ78_003473 [Callipepla squamata]